MNGVVGWTSAYLSDYPETTYTPERKQALVERIRKRLYNFTYDSHVTLPYCAPFYADKVHCVLTKAQWDNAMDEAYGDNPRGMRLIPMDVLTAGPKNGVLYEKEKFMEGSE